MMQFFDFLDVAIPVVAYLFLAGIMLGFQQYNYIGIGYRWYHYFFAALWPITLICAVFVFLLEHFFKFLGFGYSIGYDFGRMYTKKTNSRKDNMRR